VDELRLSAAGARRFLVNAFGLQRPQALPDVETALDRLEFVQMDSINVCGRIHDLILWSRVAGYRPEMLHALLYEPPRRAFEYYFPNLCVLPLRDYPYFVRGMKARAQTADGWRGLLPDEVPIAERLLARMDAEGPLRTRAGGTDDGHTTSGWGTRTTVAARVLEKLWHHGRLSTARRENFERYFDRTERLLPEAAALHAAADADLPAEADERAYRVRKRLRARRLFRPRREEAAALEPGELIRVLIENGRRPWYALAEDVPRLRAAEASPVSDEANLLAPLDPLVYDRERTRDVFGFDYTWEVYTPAAKRRWGYYVLPVLWGDRLAARVDPKIDRKGGILMLQSLALEPGVDADALARPLAARLAAFARFLGSRPAGPAARVVLGRVEPEAARASVAAALAEAVGGGA
jgi:hypothetical protein